MLIRLNKLNLPRLENFSDKELAALVWKGVFGDGDVREFLLGERYAKVQKEVNKGNPNR